MYPTHINHSDYICPLLNSWLQLVRTNFRTYFRISNVKSHQSGRNYSLNPSTLMENEKKKIKNEQQLDSGGVQDTWSVVTGVIGVRSVAPETGHVSSPPLPVPSSILELCVLLSVHNKMCHLKLQPSNQIPVLGASFLLIFKFSYA